MPEKEKHLYLAKKNLKPSMPERDKNHIGRKN